jgi:hypothetical protein
VIGIVELIFAGAAPCWRVPATWPPSANPLENLWRHARLERFLFIQRKEPAEDGAGFGLDQMDLTQIPGVARTLSRWKWW